MIQLCTRDSGWMWRSQWRGAVGVRFVRDRGEAWPRRGVCNLYVDVQKTGNHAGAAQRGVEAKTIGMQTFFPENVVFVKVLGKQVSTDRKWGDEAEIGVQM